MSESQVYRVTDYLGNAVTEDVMAEIKHPKLNSTKRVYASMDAGRPVPKHDSNGSRVAAGQARPYFKRGL